MLPSQQLQLVLALADGRLPVGGHAHSSGLEISQHLDGTRDAEQVRQFLTGRLTTTGATEANLIAAIILRSADGEPDWGEIDREIDARTPSAAQRATSRMLGRHWARAADRLGMSEATRSLRDTVEAPHQAAVFAALAHHLELDAHSAVSIHLHHLCAMITSAATRLSGLDPYVAQRIHLDLLERCAVIANRAVAVGGEAWEAIPAVAGPAAEIGASLHLDIDGRLFQS